MAVEYCESIYLASGVAGTFNVEWVLESNTLDVSLDVPSVVEVYVPLECLVDLSLGDFFVPVLTGKEAEYIVVKGCVFIDRFSRWLHIIPYNIVLGDLQFELG